jgi:carbamoyl-phosphate synthase large subunit
MPGAERIWYVAEALRRGMPVDTVAQLTHIDLWFLTNIQQIVSYEDEIRRYAAASPFEDPVFAAQILPKAKQYGFSDDRIAALLDPPTGQREQVAQRIRTFRLGQETVARFKMVDTCGAEFIAHTPYFSIRLTSASVKRSPRRSKKL